jgi:TolB-like protein
LWLVPRPTSEHARTVAADVSTIARKLNVGTILEGTVRRAGNTVRITVKDAGAYDYAQIFAQWRDKVAALKWLSMAERLLDSNLDTLKIDSAFDPIRNEPEFKALLARLNFPS